MMCVFLGERSAEVGRSAMNTFALGLISGVSKSKSGVSLGIRASCRMDLRATFLWVDQNSKDGEALLSAWAEASKMETESVSGRAALDYKFNVGANP